MNKGTNIHKEKNTEINNYTVSNKINMEDCLIISERIKQENIKNGKHMLEKTAEDIYSQSKEVFCCKVADGKNIIGFINAMKVKHDGVFLLEAGSIIVHTDYQKNGIGFLLKKELLNLVKKHGNNPIYSVSNQIAVQKINQKLTQKKYIKKEIPKQILETIESTGKLLDDDFVYINESLFKLFNECKDD